QDGRLAEAEVEARRALTNWLKLGGKYNLNTARIIGAFAMTLVQQGRYGEAETLTRNVIQIYEALGAERDSQVYASSLNGLAGILALQGRWAEAAETYARLDESTKNWDAGRKDDFALDVTRIFTLYNTNDPNGGIVAAKRLVARQTGKFGEHHPETAL